MTKNYYILLLLVCISICKSDKASPKNLRKLDKKNLSFSKAENLVAENKGLKFDIVIGETSDLDAETDYLLTILCNSDKSNINKINKVSAKCRYKNSETSHKLECKYDEYDVPYYGLIQLPKSANVLSTDTDTISLQLSSEVTLTQNVQLTYEKTEIEYTSSGTTHFNLQIYATGSSLSNSAFYQVDISKDSKNIIGNCTYSTYLSCVVNGGNTNLIKLLKDKANGSVNWIYTGTSTDFEKTQLIKFTAYNVLGYNSKYEESKWTFSLLESSCNINKAGYYFSIQVLLDKEGESDDITALAICTTTTNEYHQTCEIEKMLEPSTGTQGESDLVYLTTNQEGSTFSSTDSSLNANKIISREMTLTFVGAYELKYESSKWHFKIKISDDGLRNGLNVTVDVLWNDNDYTQGTCTHENKVLSCMRVKSQGQQDDELIYLSFERKYGSITWKDNSSGKTKIPLAVELSNIASYYLKFENSKWTFKIDAKCSQHKIPADSLIIVDISYGSSEEKTTANCEKNSEAAVNGQTTFTCECSSLTSSEDSQLFKLINKESGSVTWSGNNIPVSIARKIEFNFVKAYNMELIYNSSTKKWSFDIDFENTEGLNLQTSDTFSLDISRSTSSGFTDITGTCKLKAENTNTFSCDYSYSYDAIKTYVLFIRTTKHIDPKTINWIGGISGTYSQIYLKAELNFLKGTLSYANNKWNLNIDITVQTPTDGLLADSKLLIDITQDGIDKTMDCFAGTNLLKCDTTISNESAGTLPSFILKRIKSTSSTVSWVNTQTDNTFYYFYLVAGLDCNKAEHLKFEDNKWKFELDTSIPVKNIIKIDILYGDADSTATCVKEYDKVLCTVDYASQNKNTLVKIKRNKSSESTVTWKNLLEDKEIIADTQLNVESVKHLSYESNHKWEFKMNVIDCDLPLNSAVQIDLEYKSGSSTQPETATCILTSQTVLTCIPDVDSQLASDTFTISSSKNKGSVTYSSTSDKLIFQNSKNLAFEKVYDLTLKENDWEFKVKVTDTNLNNDESIDIDVKLNSRKKTAQCKHRDKILTCTIAKTNNSDKIVLMNNDDNQDLVWSNLDDDIRLYISYYVKFDNVYGGFYENKWQFNLKYSTTTNTIDAIGGYTLLDITVDNRNEKAECEIAQKYLLCVSQHSSQKEDENLKIYGSSLLGTVSFSSSISDAKKTIKPLSIILKDTQISDFDPSNALIKFKIKGTLEDDDDNEFEIADKTMTGVQVVVTKKTGTKEESDAICLTNEINDSPVELSCEVSGTVNEDEDNVDIKVDSDGKSNYVKFSSIKENIKVYNHEDKKEEQNNNGEDGTKTDTVTKTTDKKLIQMKNLKEE